MTCADFISARRIGLCAAAALFITAGIARAGAANLAGQVGRNVRGGKNFEIGAISCSHN
jgi:hypothetical protein